MTQKCWWNGEIFPHMRYIITLHNIFFLSFLFLCLFIVVHRDKNVEKKKHHIKYSELNFAVGRKKKLIGLSVDTYLRFVM